MYGRGTIFRFNLLKTLFFTYLRKNDALELIIKNLDHSRLSESELILSSSVYKQRQTITLGYT